MYRAHVAPQKESAHIIVPWYEISPVAIKAIKGSILDFVNAPADREPPAIPNVSTSVEADAHAGETLISDIAKPFAPHGLQRDLRHQRFAEKAPGQQRNAQPQRNAPQSQRPQPKPPYPSSPANAARSGMEGQRPQIHAARPPVAPSQPSQRGPNRQPPRNANQSQGADQSRRLRQPQTEQERALHALKSQQGRQAASKQAVKPAGDASEPKKE